MSRLLDDPKEFRLLSLTTQRTTRTNVLTYCLPSVTTMEEHNQVAIESGMDTYEYDRRNYHETSSSQPFSHQENILPLRHFPLPKTVKPNAKPWYH